MATGTMVDYAVRRFKTHLSNFKGIYQQITECRLEDGWIEELESRHNIFPDIDYRIYADV
jgi:1,4-alpha-glucan branching enzyme